MDFEINATREVFPVVQFGNQIDVVFPKLVVRPDVHCAGVIFGHQVKIIYNFNQRLVTE